MQTPHYPTGDGACSKPCDCGVPCGRYLWDTRNKELVDWLVNTHLTGDISPAEQGGLINVRLPLPTERSPQRFAICVAWSSLAYCDHRNASPSIAGAVFVPESPAHTPLPFRFHIPQRGSDDALSGDAGGFSGR